MRCPECDGHGSIIETMPISGRLMCFHCGYCSGSGTISIRRWLAYWRDILSYRASRLFKR